MNNRGYYNGVDRGRIRGRAKAVIEVSAER
jgi:hypothetical protein